MRVDKKLRDVGIFMFVLGLSVFIWSIAQGVEIDLKNKDELREAYAEEFRFPLIPLSLEDEQIADRMCKSLNGPSAFALGINIQGSLMCTYSPMKLIKLKAPEYLCNIYKEKLDRIENFVVICRPKTKQENAPKVSV